MMARIFPFAILIIATSALAGAQEPLVYVPPSYVSSGSDEFDAWRTRFTARAVQVENKDPLIVEATLAGLTPNPEVQRLNESQPEFVRPIWDYMASAVSSARTSRGRELLARNRDALAGFSSSLGVPLEYGIAIWGLESGYGTNKGSSDVVRSLATFAYQGRRTALGESELLAVFDVLARGEATRDALVGSWAGAMGHTQFMPSSYLKRAIDGDNDGKRDIWNNPIDALASTLAYLGGAGWKRGEPWGFEAVAPDAFDWSLADGTMRPLSFWTSMGVIALNETSQSPLNEDMALRLLVPAGAKGAIFLVGSNYDAIRDYNASDAYSLSVATLADQIAGRGSLPSRWPIDNPPLGRADVTLLQGLLNEFGFLTSSPDGQAGPRTRAALQAFQKNWNQVADGYPSLEALTSVKVTMAALKAVGANPGAISTVPAPKVPSEPVPAPIPESQPDPNYKGPAPVKMTW
jgi:membrane-bound lytic murein transglycosylase B